MSLARRLIVYSASVTISRAYGCQGNCDITADIVMHENSNSRGAVARRPELGEVMGQTAKLIVVLWTQSAWVARRGSISLLLAQTRLITAGGDKIAYCAFVNQNWEKTHFLNIAAVEGPVKSSLDHFCVLTWHISWTGSLDRTLMKEI